MVDIDILILGLADSMEENGMNQQKRSFYSTTFGKRHATHSENLSETLIDKRKRIRRACAIDLVLNKSPDDGGVCSFCSQPDLSDVFQKAIQFRPDGPLGSGWVPAPTGAAKPILEKRPMQDQFIKGIVETWLDYCKRHHKLLCGLGSTNIRGLQVIDCDTLCIVEVESADDPGVKHDQIQQMDAIYRNSEFTLVAAAEAYSARNLRYDKDALNAFQGIIRRFSTQALCLRNIWGLSYSDHSEYETACFVWSLTWRHKPNSRLRRQHNYLTWTWFGWEGEIEYYLVGGSNIPFDNGVRILGCEDTKTSYIIVLKEITDMSQESWRFTVLNITAVVMPSEYISYQPTKDTTWPWVIAKRKAKLSFSSNYKSELQLAESLKRTLTWRCVYIGGLLDRTFILVLKLNFITDTRKRAGIFYVGTYAKTMDKAFTGLDLGEFRIE
ncbi:hypothetical protein FHL15_008045 [Xylaria flabelliformis]|uniref:Heterokaryon incompatibility domain-containing protein n=1 Tax=Xylaria flabelliformis TaxID=2512241 RepID=A0A553HSY7_9PEZI|nr:hypothetical protein FHL15_008045 [Xylaria flabelliformis]